MRRADVPVRVRGSVVQVRGKDAGRDAVVHVAAADERTDARRRAETARQEYLTNPLFSVSSYLL